MDTDTTTHHAPRTPGDEWVNLAEAADIIGMSYAKLLRWVKAGLIPSEAPNGGGSGNRRYVHQSTVELMRDAAHIYEERQRQTIADIIEEISEGYAASAPAMPPGSAPTSKVARRSRQYETLQWLVGIETDDCVEWPLGTYPSGYGRVYVDGDSRYAHRYALIESGSMPTPEKNVTRHLCNNKPCVNPRHLRWGTQQENVDDRQRDGVWAEAMRRRYAYTAARSARFEHGQSGAA